MVSTRPGLSVEAQVWEKFRNQVQQGERSKVMEELMKEYIDMKDSDVKELRSQLNQKKEKLEELKEQKDETELEISETEKKIERLKDRISDAKDQRREEQQVWDDLLNKVQFEGNMDENNFNVEYFENKLGIDWQDIKKEAKDRLEDRGVQVK